MMLPEGNQAAQQVGPAQQRAVRRGRAAQGDVIAAAGASVAAIEHEFLGGQARQPGLLVQRGGGCHQAFPVGGRVDIDLDHAGIGRDQQLLQARVPRRFVTLNNKRHFQRGRGVLYRRYQLDVVFQILQRWDKGVQATAADLQAQGRAHNSLVVIGVRQHVFRGFAATAKLHVSTLDQLIPGLKGIALGGDAVGLPGAGRQVVERQPQSHRGVAGDQRDALALHRPQAAVPVFAALRHRPAGAAAQGYHHSRGHVEAAFYQSREPPAVQASLELLRQNVEVLRQVLLLHQVVQAVLESGLAALAR